MARRVYFVFETPGPHAGARERRARREGRWTMGPLHGAIVSWCGHRHGDRDFDDDDDDGSRDTLGLNIVTLGELSQNDRHEPSMSRASRCAGSRSTRPIRSPAWSPRPRLPRRSTVVSGR